MRGTTPQIIFTSSTSKVSVSLSLTYSLLEAFISIHQGHERFHEILREDSVLLVTSFSALLRAQNSPIEQRTASTVDQILAKGDRLCLNSHESRSIPDTET